MKTKIILKNTVLFFAVIMFAIINFECRGQNEAKAEKQKPTNHSMQILTGAEQYKQYLPLLEGKKVGVLTNQTGIVAINSPQEHPTKYVHLIDYLLEKNINIQKIYAPEHGFRGTADAGELVKDGKDTKTGLPIISLYGNNKKPTKAQLAGIDIMVFDLQDVGARFYTYISSLHYLMEACAENNIPLIVLDRPNPKGSTIDGPILELSNKSFVGMHPVPVLHGMTIGEYAQMINGEKWLNDNLQADLTVIKCANYHKNMAYSLPVKPSPNLPNDLAINLYTSLCFFEGTNVNAGRGTDNQFQIYGSPFLQNMPYSYTPQANEGAKYPKHKGKKCFGENLTQHDFIDGFSLKWLIKAYQNTSQKNDFFNNFFIKLAGTSALQKQIEAGKSEQEIKASWQSGLADFAKTRSKYLLYPETQNINNMSEQDWKDKLTPEQYHILREKGTERPFSGEYDNFYRRGEYVCAACGNLLFDSHTKFDAGCGWPSFDQAIEGSVAYHQDLSHGRVRTEVTCAQCEGHLGHVFDDGPKETTGQRYCMNSVALKFIPAQD